MREVHSDYCRSSARFLITIQSGEWEAVRVHQGLEQVVDIARFLYLYGRLR
jgi:hypothetical protein